MKLKVIRFWDNGKSTVGSLLLDNELLCLTLEDEKRDVKVKGETRIPEGIYKIVLRKEGTHHINYSKKFSSIHKGMLHIINVPNFQYILIHIGNYETDTDGCLLVGDKLVYNGSLEGSTTAYTRIYPKIAAAIEKGEEVTIEFIDIQETIK